MDGRLFVVVRPSTPFPQVKSGWNSEANSLDWKSTTTPDSNHFQTVPKLTANFGFLEIEFHFAKNFYFAYAYPAYYRKNSNYPRNSV